MKNIRTTLQYVSDTLGIQLIVKLLSKSELGALPVFIQSIYTLYNTSLFNREIVLAEMISEDFSIHQTEKQLQLIKKQLNKKVILVLDQVQAYIRKRLIEKGINFVVPGKQLYLPELLVDLREGFVHPNKTPKHESLLPSAQILLIYHLLHKQRAWGLEELTFKEIAKKLTYSPMAISKAIDNLKIHALVDVWGEKTKCIQFKHNGNALWNIVNSRHLLVNPVIKTVYGDALPKDLHLLKSNLSALSQYSDINEGDQTHYAIEKSVFYDLIKRKILIHLNEFEGSIALEIWKYDPAKITRYTNYDRNIVDPLSLYLSLKSVNDERIQLALYQLINNIVWSKV